MRATPAVRHSGILAPNFPVRSELGIVRAMLGRTNLLNIIANRAAAYPIDVNGGCFGNYNATWSNADYQRYAVWVLSRGIYTSNATDLANAYLSSTYAFQHFDATGFFTNSLGATPLQAAEAESFFLQWHSRLYAVAAELGGTYATSITANSANYTTALTWLAGSSVQSSLVSLANQGTNRLIFDALAYTAGGNILGGGSKTSLNAIATSFLNLAYGRQQAAGYFTELGAHGGTPGPDTGYGGVALGVLALVWLLAGAGTIRDNSVVPMQSLLAWLLANIDATTGRIDDTNNTRTKNDPAQSVENKQINYPEVATALFYAGVILGSPYACSMADQVAAYAFTL